MRANASTPSQVGLSSAGKEILRAVAPVVLGDLLPKDRGLRGEALEEALGALDDYVAHLSLPLQGQARTLLALIHFAPVRIALLRTTRRWDRATPAQVEAFLLRSRHSRVLLLRRIFDFLQSMTVISWFDLPRSWDAIDYPGPPVERPYPQGEQA
jgi:hypothetical protein